MKLAVSEFPGTAGFLHTEQKQHKQVTCQAARQVAACPWKCGPEKASNFSPTSGNAWVPGVSASCRGLSEEVTYNVCMFIKMTHFLGGGNYFIPPFNKLTADCKYFRI